MAFNRRLSYFCPAVYKINNSFLTGGARCKKAAAVELSVATVLPRSTTARTIKIIYKNAGRINKCYI
jgi:hypothetical protein